MIYQRPCPVLQKRSPEAAYTIDTSDLEVKEMYMP